MQILYTPDQNDQTLSCAFCQSLGGLHQALLYLEQGGCLCVDVTMLGLHKGELGKCQTVYSGPFMLRSGLVMNILGQSVTILLHLYAQHLACVQVQE
jgi:hypothetical protein